MFGALEAGAGAMQRDAGIPAVAVYVVEATIIIVVLLGPGAGAARRGPRPAGGRLGRRRMMEPLAVAADVLVAAVGIATPLALAATGETVAERSGVVNLGIEGAMLFGALGGAIGATLAGPAGGLGLGVLAGVLVAALFAARGRRRRCGPDHHRHGGDAGQRRAHRHDLPAVLWRRPAWGSRSRRLPRVPIPRLSGHPARRRRALLAADHDLPGGRIDSADLVALFRTRPGLALRAAGEDPVAARAAGVPVRLTRTVAVLVGGAFAGLAGATLVLAQVGTFAERMTAGRGFIAIAIVVLGRWNPVGAALAALLFGLATALQFAFQAAGLRVPYQLFLMFPYLLTLLALAGVVGRVKAPGALGRNEV